MVVDDDLAERLRLVADVLGGRQLPLTVVIRALLVEAAERLETERKNRATCADHEQGPRKKEATDL